MFPVKCLASGTAANETARARGSCLPSHRIRSNSVISVTSHDRPRSLTANQTLCGVNVRRRASPVRKRVGRDDGSGHATGAGAVAAGAQAARLPLGRFFGQLARLHLQPGEQTRWSVILHTGSRSDRTGRRILFSPVVLAGTGSQGAAGQGVKVWRVTQSPGGHGEPLTGGGGAQTADHPVQTALAEARGLEGSPRVCHCGTTQKTGFNGAGDKEPSFTSGEGLSAAHP